MLSYLHGFHAGNFADIQKHAAQVLALRMLQKKPSGIAYFDTHAGSALYDLTSERARKTGEADGGVHKVWPLRKQLSGDWGPVLAVLAELEGNGEQLKCYPGSPEWFRRFQRSQDDLTVFELHPAEGAQLAAWASGGTIRTFREDGMKGLLRTLPPRQPRLMVLMDPSFEVKTDYLEVADTLARAWQKCRHGVFLVWYPILTSGLEQQLKDAVVKGPVTRVLCSEIHLRQPPGRGMVGSGMLVVNPPWGFDERLQKMLSEVCGPSELNAAPSMEWLVPE